MQSVHFFQCKIPSAARFCVLRRREILLTLVASLGGYIHPLRCKNSSNENNIDRCGSANGGCLEG